MRSLLLLWLLTSVLQAENKVVLITGASRGIGRATAEYLAEQGYTVYAPPRNSLDVTNPSEKLIDAIVEKEGRIDVVINNAAYALAGPLECLTLDEMHAQMEVNFFGPIRVCQAVLPQMRKQKSGHIINISSEQGSYGLPYGSLYTASKAALESLSEALSIELLPWNIKISIVQPGMVATNFTVQLGTREVNDYSKVCQKIADSLTEVRTPSETCQSPQEVAQFLCNVIEDPNPKLRYQTSKSAEESVSHFLKDPSGQEYTNWIKSLIDPQKSTSSDT